MRAPADRRRFAPVLAVAAALLLGAAVAEAKGIRAVANRTEATVNDQIVLSVTVEGSSSDRPELPPLDDFEVYPRGQQTQMSWINGRSTSSVTYDFVLVPRGIGEFEIGPATVEIDGRSFASEPFTIRILESAAESSEGRELFVSAHVSTTTPYVGQQVVYVWRFYRRVRVGNARLEPTELEGFLVEDLGDVREYQAAVEGRQYAVSEIRKAIFPQEVGPMTLEPALLRVDVLREDRRRRSLFDDFFSTPETETRVLRSEPIELEVQPLPPGPPGYTGLVGEFELRASINKSQLAVGESATLELRVSGSGNTQLISEPPLPPLPGFKVYDERPSGSLAREGSRLTGSKTFKKVLVPLEAGQPTIPPLELPYFDPESGSYRVARTEAIPLSVRPAAGEEELRLTESMAPDSGKVAVRIVADDILPLYEDLDAVEPDLFFRRGWPLWTGLLVPFLAYVGLEAAVRRRRRFERDAGLRRRRAALRRARGRLRELRVHDGDGRGAAELASRCLREFVGDKLGVEGGALTAREVYEELGRRRVGDGLADETAALLRSFEAAKYGAGSVTPAEAADRLEPLIKRLDREIRA